MKQLSDLQSARGSANGPIHMPSLAAILMLALAMGVTTGCGTATGQTGESSSSSGPSVADQANSFLTSPEVGKEVIGYVHMGARYNGHEYLKTMGVSDGNGGRKAGHFALVYRFNWEDDGVSDIAFLCNPSGRVYGLKVVSSNATLNQPFMLANLSIQILGNVLIEAYKDKMDDGQRRGVQRFVDEADAQGMLTWALGFQQVAGS